MLSRKLVQRLSGDLVWGCLGVSPGLSGELVQEFYWEFGGSYSRGCPGEAVQVEIGRGAGGLCFQ